MRGEAGEGLANIISIHNIHDHLSNQIAANPEQVNFIHDLVVRTCGCANVHKPLCGCTHSPEFMRTVQLSTDGHEYHEILDNSLLDPLPLLSSYGNDRQN